MRKLFLALIAVIACSLSLSAQTKTISGTVVDAANNEPLIGATIMPVGGGQGTAADVDGHFTLTVPSNVTKANVTYVGYHSKTVDLHNGMTVYLASNSTDLDDVVVVAYGTANKASISGSVSVVGAKEIEDRPITTATAALEGNAPGVQVNNTYGQPGTAPDIRIRGFTSASGYNDPIYIVDGVPFSGTLADINPADVESMTVLKDAASAALYGNKAANGVILITTKRAKQAGKVDVTLTISQGMYNRGLPMYDRLEANQWMEAMFQGKLNDLVSVGEFAGDREGAASYLQNRFVGMTGGPQVNIYGVPDDQVYNLDGTLAVANPLPGYTDLDWWKTVSRTGHRQEYNLNATAATEKFNIFASVGYLNEKGYVLKTDFERYTARVNANFQPVSYLKFGANIFAAAQNGQVNDAAGGTTINDPFNTVSMTPIYPYYRHNEDGSIVMEDGQPVWNTAGYLGNSNIGLSLRKDFTDVRKYMIDGSLYGTVILPYGFDVTVRGNMVRQAQTYRDYLNNEIGSAAGYGMFTLQNGDYHSHLFQQTLNWSHEYGLHHVDFMFTHENWNSDGAPQTVQFRDQNYEGVYYISNFNTFVAKGASYNRDRTESYLGRARYNFNQKYFVDVNFRRDGSSRFGKGNRWGNFASVGAVWVITKEKFMEALPWVNFAKLRASYGSVGNNAGVGLYSSYPLYGSDTYFGQQYLIKGGFPADNVRWEATKTFDIGLEGSLFNDIFTFSIGYFDKRSTDLIFAVGKPGSAGSVGWGLSNPRIDTNIGTMSNRGWELSFGVDIINTKDFYWNFNIDATFLKNKIVKLPNHDDIIGGTQRQTEGKSLYEWCTYHYAGVDQLTGNALYELTKDSPEFWVRNAEGKMVFDEATFNTRLEQAQKSADGVIERNGKYYVTRTEWASKQWAGTALPTVYGSFGTNLSWKGIRLGMLFTYSLGGKTWDSNYEGLMTASQAQGGLHKDILSSWNGAPEGMTADSPNRIDPDGIPQFNFARYLYNNGTSDRWLTSSSYLVFKNINLSYDLPKKWVNALLLQNINLGVSIDNLFTVTARKGMNPQQSYSGAQGNTFVTARVFSFQLTAKF